MKLNFNKNSALWTAAILHVVIFAVLLLSILIESFLQDKPPHVFQMVSEPLPSEAQPQGNPSMEPMPNFELPEVEPLEIPEPRISNTTAPSSTPVEQPKEEKLISYADFRKKVPEKKSRPRTTTRPNVTVPSINTEQFSANLQSNLITVDTNTTNALTAAERTALQRYGNEISIRLNRAWTKPVNLSGINLETTVMFDVSSSGRISNIRFRPGSGNASFDESVKAAFTSFIPIGPTPTGEGHVFTKSFKMIN